MSPTIEKVEVDPQKAQAAFHIICDMLDAGDFMKIDVIVALATVLAHQYTNRMLAEKEHAQFMVDITDWLSTYWHPDGMAKLQEQTLFNPPKVLKGGH